MTVALNVIIHAFNYSELFKISEETLNEMALFVRVNIILSLNQPSRHRRNHHLVVLTFCQCEQFVGIISSVSKKLICQ